MTQNYPMVDQAKPGEALLQYYYAVTLKPNTKLEQNKVDLLNNVFRDKFGLETTCDLKYEMDSKDVLHLHCTMVVDKKLSSFYRYFKNGWHIHIKHLKDTTALDKWRNYLKKGPPNFQVLNMALLELAKNEYMFV